VRKHGGIDPDSRRKVSSEMHALFVQRLVEIRRLAKTYRSPRGERFERAAFDLVGTLERKPRGNEALKETCPRRMKQPETPALKMVRATNRIGELIDDLLAAIPPELHPEARAHIEATLRARFEGEPESVHHCIKRGGQNDESAKPPAESSWGSAQEGDSDFPAENRTSGANKVDKNGTQNPICPPNDVPSEAEVHERVAQLVRDKRIGVDEALEIKSRAHDPEARREFARRHVRPQIE
jgi:hypothetical protein